MTINELRTKFVTDFGLSEWPKAYEVDRETYNNVVMGIIELIIKREEYNLMRFGAKEEYKYVTLAFGPHNGIMFKNVELLVK